MQREGYLHHHCVEKKSHKIASRFESARLSLNGIVILGVPFNVANVNTVNIRNVHLWTFEYIHMLCLLLFLRSQSFTVETRASTKGRNLASVPVQRFLKLVFIRVHFMLRPV